ncbi:MAG: hypothetical protein PHT40_00850 [Patescibacteria group bacterium]|nr:hypothetical protein [Patescibacteria group bacterium]
MAQNADKNLSNIANALTSLFLVLGGFMLIQKNTGLAGLFFILAGSIFGLSKHKDVFGRSIFGPSGNKK